MARQVAAGRTRRPQTSLPLGNGTNKAGTEHSKRPRKVIFFVKFASEIEAVSPSSFDSSSVRATDLTRHGFRS